MARFEEVNTYFIQDLASQIAAIRDEGEVEDFLLILAMLTVNVATVNTKLQKAADKSVADIRQLCTEAAKGVFKDPRFTDALKATPLSQKAKADIDKHVKAVERETGREIRRLIAANNVSAAYQQAANGAFLARKSSFQDKVGLTRPMVRDIGKGGIHVVLGDRHGTITNSVKTVIQNGICDIEQYAYDVIGEELKFDAVEISVHDNPAPDHEPIQGHIFLRGEFDKLQNHEEFHDIDGGIYPAQDRAIGELNCRHLAFPFSTRYSKRRYSPNDLRIMEAQNKAGCSIDGKHYTLYEARQYQNRLKAERKHQEDVVLAAQAANDAFLAQQAKNRVKMLDQRLNHPLT